MFLGLRPCHCEILLPRRRRKQYYAPCHNSLTSLVAKDTTFLLPSTLSKSLLVTPVVVTSQQPNLGISFLGQVLLPARTTSNLSSHCRADEQHNSKHFVL